VIKLQGILYGIYGAIIAFIAFFTGEIVTFLMLGIILMTLHNIHSTLKEMLKVNKEILAKNRQP
jgi:chromate transport protein ChrA